jgi:hypothetical protein
MTRMGAFGRLILRAESGSVPSRGGTFLPQVDPPARQHAILTAESCMRAAPFSFQCTKKDYKTKKHQRDLTCRVSLAPTLAGFFPATVQHVAPSLHPLTLHTGRPVSSHSGPLQSSPTPHSGPLGLASSGHRDRAGSRALLGTPGPRLKCAASQRQNTKMALSLARLLGTDNSSSRATKGSARLCRSGAFDLSRPLWIEALVREIRGGSNCRIFGVDMLPFHAIQGCFESDRRRRGGPSCDDGLPTGFDKVIVLDLGRGPCLARTGPPKSL